MNNIISQHRNQMQANEQNFINDMNYLQYTHQKEINNIYNCYNGSYFPNYNFNYNQKKFIYSI